MLDRLDEYFGHFGMLFLQETSENFLGILILLIQAAIQFFMIHHIVGNPPVVLTISNEIDRYSLNWPFMVLRLFIAKVDNSKCWFNRLGFLFPYCLCEVQNYFPLHFLRDRFHSNPHH